MSTGNLYLSGSVTGGPDGARNFGPFTIQALTAVDQTTPVSLASGANTITIPAGTTSIVILPQNMVAPGYNVPNPKSTATLTLKGVTGDTGVALSNTWPTVLSWDSPPANICITASNTATCSIWFM